MRFDEDTFIMWVAAILAVIAIGGFVVYQANQDWCTGIEPDGETEQIICPEGWQPNETRNIQEDQYMEWDD